MSDVHNTLAKCTNVATKLRNAEQKRDLAKNRLGELDGELRVLWAIRRERIRERGEIAYAGLSQGVSPQDMATAMGLGRTQSVYRAAGRRENESKPGLPDDFVPLEALEGVPELRPALGVPQILDALRIAAGELDEVQRQIDEKVAGKKRIEGRLVKIRDSLRALRSERGELGRAARLEGATYLMIAEAAGKKKAAEGHDIVKRK